VFEEPYSWMPERWLEEGYGQSRAKDMSYVQWGYLRHRCYGEKFAQQFDKVAWARIISACRVQSAGGVEQVVPKPLWGSGFGTSFPEGNVPYWVSISKRVEDISS
jgi:cytochrome P450